MSLSTEHKYHYLHTDVSRIEDESLQSLFAEILNLRGEPLQGFVIHFLQSSLYPFSNFGKRKTFERSEFLLETYLPSRVGDLANGGVYRLCIDLVRLAKLKSPEDIDGMKLYVLINKTVPRLDKRK